MSEHATTSKAVLELAKSGASYAEVHGKHPGWVDRHRVWVTAICQLYSQKPTHAKFALEECCHNVRKRPIPFDHADWQHTAVVMGNPGCGKTQWALAHFKNPLLITRLDELEWAFKWFDQSKRFDGIVFRNCVVAQQPFECQKHLADWNDPYRGIPAETRKIFTCSWDTFLFTRHPAVMNRLCVIELDQALGAFAKTPSRVPRDQWQLSL